MEFIQRRRIGSEHGSESLMRSREEALRHHMSNRSQSQGRAQQADAKAVAAQGAGVIAGRPLPRQTIPWMAGRCPGALPAAVSAL